MVHAYQIYPMAWSSSAHNVFVEVFADGGWPLLVVLVALVGGSLVLGWRTRAWPYALGAAALWFTLSVDVTASHANVMALAFFGLGTALSERSPVPWRGRLDRIHEHFARSPRWLGSSALVIMVTWCAAWYWPCGDLECSFSRRGAPPTQIGPRIGQVPESRRHELMQRLRAMYPESLWVLRIEQTHAADPLRELMIAREIARRFPYQHPQNYLDWARSAMAVGDIDEARIAVQHGLGVFPPHQYPFGEMRMTPARYAEWIASANAILRESR